MDDLFAKGRTLVYLVIAASLAVFMASLDATIVNIALPTISDVFDLATSQVSWVSTIYLLVLAGSIFIVGKIIDVVGIKKVFITGFIIFTIGSFACGFFPEILNSFPSLLISRIFQAIGGVIITVAAPAMLTIYYPPESKAKGVSIVVLFAAVGMALGPTLGGFLTEYMSWNWIFYINVPVGIFALIFGMLVIPKDRIAESSFNGFDAVGAGLIFVGLASLLFAFSEAFTFGWRSPVIIGTLILGAVGIIGFVIRELKTDNPILDVRLFKNRSFTFLNIILSVIFMTYAGANYLLPFYLEYVKDLSVSSAGLVLTIIPFGMLVAGLISGQIFEKLVGKIKYLIFTGLIFIAIGYFGLSHLSPVSGFWVIALSFTAIGLGLGFSSTPLMTLIMGAFPKNQQGMASSLTGIERFAPMTIGIAVFNVIFVVSIIMTVINSGITEKPAADIAAYILSIGFDMSFIILFITASVLMVLCLLVKEKALKANE